MKFLTRLVSVLSLVSLGFSTIAQTGAVPGSNCGGMNEMCSDVGSTYTSTTGVFAPPGNNYNCLGAQQGPAWFFLEVSTAGNINLSLTAPSDIDFIIWGPFSNQAAALAACGSLGTGGVNGAVEDCSFSATTMETPSIIGGLVGEVYVMMVANYAGVTQTISITPVASTGAAVCCTAPVMTSPNSATICSGATMNFPLNSTMVGTTYTWVAGSSALITGESTTTQTTSTIDNTLTNLSATPQTVTYTVTPTNAGCVGTAQTVTVTVMKNPNMTSPSTAAICSGNAVNIPLTANPAASTFTWIATDNPNVTGESLTLQTTSTLNNTLINTTSVAQVVSYTVTPTSITGLCVGTPQTVNVTVNPAPAMTSPNTATICSGGTVSIPLTADAPATFSWQATANANVTGETTTAQTTATLTDVLTNTTSSQQSVIYTVTPTATTGTCAGGPQTVTVLVNALPTVTSSNAVTICSGDPVNLTLTADMPSNFSWQATSSANVTGESTTAQSTGTITDVLTNTTSSSQTVTYSVTPTSTGGSCVGAPQTVTVTVFKLLGSAAVTNSDCQACNGFVTLSSSNGVAPFSYSDDAGVTFQPGNSFGPLCGGTPGTSYSFVIQDNQGCEVTVDATVIDINMPTLNPPVETDATCYTVCDGEILLTGTNLAAYEIVSSGGIATENASGVFLGLCPDTYTVSVDNGFGCTVSGVATITEPTALQIVSLTPDATVCAGDDITLSAVGAGGNGFYTYTWTAGPTPLGTGSNITISPTNNMTVCVTLSENCPSPTVQQCMNITVPAAAYPQMAADIVSACAPVDVTFTNLTTYGGVASTTWHFSDGGSITATGTDPVVHTFNEGGFYDVSMTITTDDGCTYDTSYVDIIETYDYPNALFSYSPNPGNIYETEITFSDFSTPEIVQ